MYVVLEIESFNEFFCLFPENVIYICMECSPKSSFIWFMITLQWLLPFVQQIVMISPLTGT